MFRQEERKEKRRTKQVNEDRRWGRHGTDHEISYRGNVDGRGNQSQTGKDSDKDRGELTLRLVLFSQTRT
jgi:hypothetical protein